MHLFRTSKAYRTLIFELVKTGIQTDTLNFQFFFFDESIFNFESTDKYLKFQWK